MLPLTFLPGDSSLIQAVVKHSQDKDQFLRVLLKRIQETQMYENELKKANEYISALFARLQELEAKCAEENRLKEGKILLPFCLIILSYSSILWIDHDFVLQSMKINSQPLVSLQALLAQRQRLSLT
jgi:hypothetical protein